MFLKTWRMRILTLAGKIVVFETIAISEIVYLSITTKIPTEIIFEKIQKRFIWPTKAKIEIDIISCNFIDGDLKNVVLNKKKASLE